MSKNINMKEKVHVVSSKGTEEPTKWANNWADRWAPVIAYIATIM